MEITCSKIAGRKPTIISSMNFTIYLLLKIFRSFSNNHFSFISKRLDLYDYIAWQYKIEVSESTRAFFNVSSPREILCNTRNYDQIRDFAEQKKKSYLGNFSVASKINIVSNSLSNYFSERIKKRHESLLKSRKSFYENLILVYENVYENVILTSC